jgi:hypothetical protein
MTVIKSRRFGWAGHVAKKSYTIFVGKPERKRRPESYRLIWRTTSNRELMKLDGSLWAEFIWLRTGTSGSLVLPG